MEIALLQKTGLRIKGKTATFLVNPQEAGGANAGLVLDDSVDPTSSDETVILNGPGEYEIGGVKISGTRGDKGVLYSMNIDGIDVLVGKIETLSAMQHKLKEHNIVISLCTEPASASFLTSLAVNVVVFYGTTAAETAQGFEKDNLQTMNKYTTAAGKLPAEVETILLA